MSQLQSIGILVAAIGGAIGGISGVLNIVKWAQDQRDRSRRLRALQLRSAHESAYEQVIQGYEDSLSSGDGHLVLEVPPQHRPYVVRAVSEGRLAWTAFANVVGLPSDARDG